MRCNDCGKEYEAPLPEGVSPKRYDETADTAMAIIKYGVERSQKTDWDEFYSTVDLTAPDLDEKLRQWQDYYNHERPHGSLGNKTPWEKWWDLVDKTPL
jgi:Integrase core domain